jgi:sporulation protein YlmC with PRC-barrel domain
MEHRSWCNLDAAQILPLLPGERSDSWQRDCSHYGGVQLYMESTQFDNSRVSDAMLRTERPALQAEISNMIAEGSPVPPPEPGIAETGQPKMHRLAAGNTLIGTRVLKSAAGEELGNIEEIMLDLKDGRIAYAVLSFSGFPGIGNKRFSVPWSALEIVQDEFILDIDRRTLEGAPDFDKSNWPDMADPAFGRVVHKHYGSMPYWQHTVPDAGDFTGEKQLPDRSREYEPTAGYQSGSRH